VNISGSAEHAKIAVLENKDIPLTIEKVGEKYRGGRFDWNGLVSQIRFLGVSLLDQEDLNSHMNLAVLGRGLHNEFVITKCVGYDASSVGDWIPTIGTGWLKRNAEPCFALSARKYFSDSELSQAIRLKQRCRCLV
jgi:hypothetical protein